jgi:hypothetical protein
MGEDDGRRAPRQAKDQSADLRKRRLATALRHNLQRRKQQARARHGDHVDSAAPQAENDDDRVK